jgi:hypothetical protein
MNRILNNYITEEKLDSSPSIKYMFIKKKTNTILFKLAKIWYIK